MNGIIKTYLPEKEYGFIDGDDGKSYFFQAREVKNKSQLRNLCEGEYVSFEQHATPKGYRASNCFLLNSSEINRFVVPDKFLTSRSSKIDGWDVIEKGNWFVHGSSSESPDAAKSLLIENATHTSANALIEVEYYKTTGSTPGTGKGTYYFTIHNFKGRIVKVAKRNASGKHLESEIKGLNKYAAALKSYLEKKTKSSKRKCLIIWLTAGVCSFFSFAMGAPGLIILFAIIAFFLGKYTNFDDWLEPA